MLPEPEFPPLLMGHAVPAHEDPLRVALKGARQGSFSAGDLCWSMAETHARAAIILEPECSLAKALQMAPLLMVAIGDALGAIGPPNLALMYRWPTTLLVNGGEVGEVFLRQPEETGLTDTPGFIVLGFSVAMSLPAEIFDAPGLASKTTALFEEGCGDLDRTQVLEAVARHFLSWIDAWEHEGFGAAHADFLGRMQPADSVSVQIGPVKHDGRMIGIDEDGGLLLDGAAGVSGVSLAQGLGMVD
ncbi:biotin/lipoate--protein ligase family protein [Hoeflea sp. YIM 152468]|uniref:biotin/lipoate--protein ligase family protein n=1 Tax=Hoeflea sp. YIM 152468 TaxID=3031759 RepID=UPI0023DC6ED4|nr:biotin/lipoate--protein ligase family protein [Hoeflea sp. YIM 152468]MDF1606842.1 biotin/lipoate--protein ligase family protein [Hoeflea sp. YIM 152468]